MGGAGGVGGTPGLDIDAPLGDSKHKVYIGS